MPLPDAINRAFEEVTAYMAEPKDGTTRAAILDINLDATLVNLAEYRDAALQNFQHLKDGLHRRHGSKLESLSGAAPSPDA